MGFNYGLEKKKFDSEWLRLKREYEAAGMEESVIQEMYEFDLKSFRRRRVDAVHEQSYDISFPATTAISSVDTNSLHPRLRPVLSTIDEYSYGDECFDWIDTVSNERLYERLLLLSREDKQLLTMIVKDGLSQADIARSYHCSRVAVAKKIKRIKKFLQEG